MTPLGPEEIDDPPPANPAVEADADEDADHGASTAPEEPLDRRRLILLCTPLLVMVVMTQVGGILFPVLVQDQPLLLEGLSANNRNLANAAAKLPFATYAAVAFVRLLAPDPFFYELGWHYGDRTLGWLERRTPTIGQIMRQLEAWFGTLGWLFVLVMPNNYVCAIAGSTRMRRSLFWTLNIVGTIGRILFLWWVGQAFADLIDTITGWIAQYRWPLLAVTVGIFALSSMREWRAGTSGVQQIVKLEKELEEANEDESA